MVSECQHCGRAVAAHEQMYQSDDRIVCGPCAGVAPAIDELAAAARAKRPAVRKKRASSFSPVVVAVVVVMTGIGGGVGYMIYSGKLADTVAEQREAMTGASTVNSVIDRYNTLIAEANRLAAERKFAQAADSFRDARAVASAVPDVAKQVDVSQLESIIAHYDALAAGRTPANTITQTIRVYAPRPQTQDDPSIAQQPTGQPDIRFMEKGAVPTDSNAIETDASTTLARDESESAKSPRRSRTDAYTVPK